MVTVQRVVPPEMIPTATDGTALTLALLMVTASAQAIAQVVAPDPSAPGRSMPPTRPADGPDAPHWTALPGAHAGFEVSAVTATLRHEHGTRAS